MSYESYDPTNEFWKIVGSVFNEDILNTPMNQQSVYLRRNEFHNKQKGVLEINVPGYNSSTIRVGGERKNGVFFFEVSFLKAADQKTVERTMKFSFSKNKNLYDYSQGEAKVKDGVLTISVPKKDPGPSSRYDFNVS